MQAHQAVDSFISLLPSREAIKNWVGTAAPPVVLLGSTWAGTRMIVEGVQLGDRPEVALGAAIVAKGLAFSLFAAQTQGALNWNAVAKCAPFVIALMGYGAYTV
jgi:hypothetical protein